MVQIEDANFKDKSVPIYVYGTSGYGKSYLLTALVLALIKRGKRVIYFPDCQALVNDKFGTFLDALRFAYHDDSAALHEINDANFRESEGGPGLEGLLGF